MTDRLNNEWKSTKTDIFWAEIAPCDHVVQIYESDNAFLDALSGFVGGGINAGESVIVIATEEHLEALNKTLRAFGISVETLVNDDRYIPLSADQVLSKFMVEGWPNEELFNKTISEIIERADCRNRSVRAFGEMVAILWAQGHTGATINLEHLWNKFCQKHALSLFCAYPKTGFTRNINQSISDICSCHSKIISGTDLSLTQLQYRDAS